MGSWQDVPRGALRVGLPGRLPCEGFSGACAAGCVVWKVAISAERAGLRVQEEDSDDEGDDDDETEHLIGTSAVTREGGSRRGAGRRRAARAENSDASAEASRD